MIVKSIFLILFFSLMSCSTVFKDNFSNNKNKWKLFNSKEFLVDISNGKLHIEKFSKNRINNGCLWYHKEIKKFNTSKDFSILFYAKIIKSDDIYNCIDFEWGNLSDEAILSKLYQVSFSVTGEIHLDYFDKGWSYLYREKLPIINKKQQRLLSSLKIFTSTIYYPLEDNEFNKYEICQIGDSCKIKINDKQVFSKRIKAIAGNSIGFQQCLKVSWEIDKIVIKQ